MRLVSSAGASWLREPSSLMSMHSKPCNASARTTALPWPTPPVKITVSTPPMDATYRADVLRTAIAVGFERDQSALMTLIGRSKNFTHVA